MKSEKSLNNIRKIKNMEASVCLSVTEDMETSFNIWCIVTMTVFVTRQKQKFANFFINFFFAFFDTHMYCMTHKSEQRNTKKYKINQIKAEKRRL